jgi:hypothetical protein
MKMKAALALTIVLFMLFELAYFKKVRKSHSQKGHKVHKHKSHAKCHSKGKCHSKEIVVTDNTKVFQDKTLDPTNARTKLNMLRSFISAVLDQLEVSDSAVKTIVENSSTENLLSCMSIFKDIARDIHDGQFLSEIEKYLGITGLKDKLVDANKVKRAV